MRLVLDSNIWLDWLVFADPGTARIRAAIESGDAEVFIDDACEAELRRVLNYPFRKKVLEAAQQEACIAQCLAVSRRIEGKAPAAKLPKCKDPDDQKFLAAALAAEADYLVTRDIDLLELSRRDLPFRIVKPDEIRFE